jgi:hypothetical protein
MQKTAIDSTETAYQVLALCICIWEQLTHIGYIRTVIAHAFCHGYSHSFHHGHIYRNICFWTWQLWHQALDNRYHGNLLREVQTKSWWRNISEIWVRENCSANKPTLCQLAGGSARFPSKCCHFVCIMVEEFRHWTWREDEASCSVMRYIYIEIKEVRGKHNLRMSIHSSPKFTDHMLLPTNCVLGVGHRLLAHSNTDQYVTILILGNNGGCCPHAFCIFSHIDVCIVNSSITYWLPPS